MYVFLSLLVVINQAAAAAAAAADAADADAGVCVQDHVSSDLVTTAVVVRATTPSCASVREVSRELDVNTVGQLTDLCFFLYLSLK